MHINTHAYTLMHSRAHRIVISKVFPGGSDTPFKVSVLGDCCWLDGFRDRSTSAKGMGSPSTLSEIVWKNALTCLSVVNTHARICNIQRDVVPRNFLGVGKRQSQKLTTARSPGSQTSLACRSQCCGYAWPKYLRRGPRTVCAGVACVMV